MASAARRDGRRARPRTRPRPQPEARAEAAGAERRRARAAPRIAPRRDRVDRRRRDPARGRRLREPRRAPPQPAPRLGDAGADEAPRRERGARRRSSRSALASPRIQSLAHAAGRARRRPTRRPSATSTSGADGLADAGEAGEPPDPPPARRLRARVRGDARAGGLAAGRRRRRTCRASRRASTRRPRRSRPAAARSSTAPASSSRSASRRRPSTPTRSRCATRARSRSRRTTSSASTRTRSIPQLLDKKSRFVYVKRFADPADGGALPEEGLPRRRLLPRGAAHLPAGRGRRAGARLRGRRQPRPGRARAAVRPQARRPRRQADDRARPDRPGDRRDQLAARPGRAPTSSPRSTTRSRRRPRRCCARRSRKWGAKDATAIVLDPSHGRGARDGADARLQREQHLERGPLLARHCCATARVTDTYEPGSTFKLVTVTGALSEGLVTPTHALHAARTSIQYGSCWQCTVHDAEERGTVDYSRRADPRVLVERRRDHARREARRASGSRDWVRQLRLRLDRPASTSRARAPGFVLPLEQWCGLDDRQRADRPGHRGDADPDGVGLRRGRERRRLDPAAPRRPRRRPRARQADAPADHVDRRSTGEIKTMLTGVVAGRAARAPRRRSRATRSPARPAPRRCRRRTATRPPTTSRRSSAWCRRRIRGSSCSSRSTSRAASIFGGVVAAPAFAAIAKFDLQYLEVPPDAPDGTRSDRRLGSGAAPSIAADTRVARDEPGALHRGARAGRGRRRRASEPAAVDVSDLAYDTRAVRPGALFFCVRGRDAPTGTRSRRPPPRSARRRSSSSTRSTSPLPQLVVPDVARRDARRGDALLRRPDARARGRRRSPARTARRRPRSCSHAILEATGGSTGLLTNIERRVGGEQRPTGLNTPEAIDLQRLFREMARRRRPRLRDGGDLDRAGAGPARRDALRRARVHEPDAGPPRLPRHDGGVLRGEARALRAGRARRRQRRRRVRAAARRRAARTRHVRRRRPTRSTGSTSSCAARFNRENAIGAALAARALGVDDDAIRRGIESVARRARAGSRRSTRGSRSR